MSSWLGEIWLNITWPPVLLTFSKCSSSNFIVIMTKKALYKDECDRKRISDIFSQRRADVLCAVDISACPWQVSLFIDSEEQLLHKHQKCLKTTAAAARHILINKQFTDWLSHAVLQRETKSYSQSRYWEMMIILEMLRRKPWRWYSYNFQGCYSFNWTCYNNVVNNVVSQPCLHS